jgi:hypothetical protein
LVKTFLQPEKTYTELLHSTSQTPSQILDGANHVPC